MSETQGRSKPRMIANPATRSAGPGSQRAMGAMGAMGVGVKTEVKRKRGRQGRIAGGRRGDSRWGRVILYHGEMGIPP